MVRFLIVPISLLASTIKALQATAVPAVKPSIVSKSASTIVALPTERELVNVGLEAVR